MTDERDPIIDSLLDEVLGDEQPPDLTRRILGAHHACAGSGEIPAMTPPIVTAAKSHRTQSRRPKPGRQSTGQYTGWASLAVVLIGAGLFATWAWQQTAQNERANRPPAIASITNSESTPNTEVAKADKLEGQEAVAVIPEWAEPELVQKQLRRKRIADNRDLPDDNPDSSKEQVIDSPKFARRVRLGKPSTDSQVVNFINAQLKAGWKKSDITPTKSVGDMEWFDRATDTVLGRGPTTAEKKKFAQRRDREEAINQLLSTDEFARHWAKRLADVLVGGATSNGFDQLSLEQYLFESFKSHKPYDELAFELVTAQGSSKTDDKSHNPAVNFLLAYQVDSPSQTSATDKVCQVFLGKQMQCLRCHDHPANEKLAQQSYWDIAAYFTQMRTMATPNGPGLVDRDYAGDDGKSLDEAELFYSRPDSLATAYPNFPGQNKPLSKSGRISEINRRVELANSIVASEDFPMAAVNRMWRQVFRSGFTHPVDDMGEHNTPSQPKLLRGLASEFKNSGYDVRSALRWMLRSIAFDRRIRDTNDSLIANLGDDEFSSFARPDLINHRAIRKPLAKLASSLLNNRSYNPTIVLGNMGADDVPPAAAAKARRRINARHRERLLTTESGSLLARLDENRSLSDTELVEHLFFALVGRAPNNSELRSGKIILDNSRKVDGLIEIGQIILSSEEFKTQH